MEKLKLLYIVNEFIEASVNELVLDLIRHLDPNAYQIYAGCVKQRRGGMQEAIRDAGAQIVSFRPGSAVLNIRRFIRQEQIDIVHTHVLRADLIGGIATRLAGRGVLISTKHNFGYVSHQSGWLWRNLFYWPVMYLPDHLIFVNEVHRKRVTRLPFIKSHHVLSIPNGVDVDFFAMASGDRHVHREFNIEDDITLVVYLGRLVRGKGLEALIDAMQILKKGGQHLHLLIVGTGPLQHTLEHRIKSHHLNDYVTLTGYRSDIAEILSAADIFALPSHSEGLPLSLLEAMAAGKAVVVTTVDGIIEVVHANETGVFVPLDSPTDLASALRQLAKDPRTRDRLGRAAQAFVREHYTNQRMTDAYDRLYRDCVAAPINQEGVLTR
ncbi:MAG: glycosyltransferase family 4 protein [Chloroflexota bacterium]